MTHTHGQWYIRKNGDISGPFNGSVIVNHLIIGRLDMDDEVSADKQQWLPLRNQPSLHPDISDEDKARRYLDERTGLDRREQQQTPPPEANQRRGERRAPEMDIEQARRALRQHLLIRYRQRRELMFWPLLITIAVLLFVAVLAVLYPTKIPIPLPNCSAPAEAGVNWSNCLKSQAELANIDMSGAKLRNSQLTAANMMNTKLADADIAYANLRHANLSYSDLSGASLFGANLGEADLSNADLTAADLAYADLSNARIGGAELSEARLDHAIWIDGRVCAIGSTGSCLSSE